MALYTFYLCQPDGSAASFEAVELADDAAAVDHAPAMLDQHRSCAYVMVWEGERRVHTRRRAERPANDAGIRSRDGLSGGPPGPPATM